MFNSARENGEPHGDNFAPPLLIDGDVQISQSVATCLYLGHKLGLTPPGYNDFKAMQFCATSSTASRAAWARTTRTVPRSKAFSQATAGRL